MFYLKVNIDESYTLPCLEKWVRVAELKGDDYLIICDNKKLEERIVSSGRFLENIKKKIIPSDESVSYLSELHLGENWYKAGNAHLTTFSLAQKSNLENFWNIDADDIMFLMNDEDLCAHLSAVEDYTKKNQIDMFSLDIWHTHSHGLHWSFGVTFIQNTKNWFKLLENQDFNFKKELDSLINNKNLYNLDWLFTILNLKKVVKAETFYSEDKSFIHHKFFNPGFGIVPAPYYFRKDRKLEFMALTANPMKLPDDEIAIKPKEKYKLISFLNRILN